MDILLQSGHCTRDCNCACIKSTIIESFLNLFKFHDCSPIFLISIFQTHNHVVDNH